MGVCFLSFLMSGFGGGGGDNDDYDILIIEWKMFEFGNYISYEI